MTGEVLNIEQIVAEVVRRLRLLADAPTAAVSRPQESHAPVAAAPSAAAPSAATLRQSDDLVLDARVVTTATVHGRLAGVRRVLVQQGAVVTPSVKDDLRKRGIRLEVCTAAECGPAGADLTVVRFLRSPAASRAAATLPLPSGGREQLCEELGPAVRCAAESVSDARQVAVVLTDEALAAVCLLNRRPQLRAAQARSADEAKQAVRTIGANVLVVDPRDVTANQWQVLVRVLRDDLPRGCPAMLQAGSA